MAAIEIDRRQRLAAATLLSAVDLPQPATDVAQLWIKAAEVCPGVCLGEFPIGLGRVGMLEAARNLIDEMLTEARVCSHPAVTETIGGPKVCDDCGAMV